MRTALMLLVLLPVSCSTLTVESDLSGTAFLQPMLEFQSSRQPAEKVGRIVQGKPLEISKRFYSVGGSPIVAVLSDDGRVAYRRVPAGSKVHLAESEFRKATKADTQALSGTVGVGFSEEMVFMAWGIPGSKKTEQTILGTTHFLYYGRMFHGGLQVQTINGKVSLVSNW